MSIGIYGTSLEQLWQIDMIYSILRVGVPLLVIFLIITCMKRILLIGLVYVTGLISLFSQKGFNPVERSEDFYYESAMLRGSEKVMFVSGYREFDYSIDVLKKNGDLFTIENPGSISERAQPFYYKRESADSILTGWICPKGDSFSLIMTRFHPLSNQHEILQQELMSGVFTYALTTKIRHHNNSDIIFLTITEKDGPTDQMALLQVNNGGEIFILGSAIWGVDPSRATALLFGEVVDINVLNDSTFIIRGFLDVGIGIINCDLEILNYRGGRFIDKGTGNTYFTESFGFGMELMKDEIWTFGLTANFVFNRSDPNLGVYHLEKDSVIMDSIYFYRNPEGTSREIGKSVKLGEQDAMICTRPYIGGASWKTYAPSEMYFKRITDKKEIWHKKYSSEYLVRPTDMILTDSCEVMVVGSIFDYFNSGFLQGFYATFDCDGNLLTTNVELRKEEVVSIYPNPASDQITIKTDFTGQINYRLSSMDGRCATEGKLHNNSVDVSQLEEGVYIFTILTESGAHSEKVVISR